MRIRLVPLLAGTAVAVIALALLAPRSSYQPGALLSAHHQLSSDCAACHRPWRGASNNGCVSCHGDITNNPHGGFDVTEQDTGLIPGHSLTVGPSHTLECLSCHSEHQGSVIDVSARAGFACTWCHQHPAIAKVAEHQVPVMQREIFVRHLFKRHFDHHEHQRLIKSHHPPIEGGFRCASCHLVTPSQPGKGDQMSFKWTGCAGSGCHLIPQDRFLELPESLGRSPASIPYLSVIPVRHIKAVFVHSAGHLASSCETCHFKVAESRAPDDPPSLAIMRCFDCHAHQLPGPQNHPSGQTAALATNGHTSTPILAEAPSPYPLQQLSGRGADLTRGERLFEISQSQPQRSVLSGRVAYAATAMAGSKPTGRESPPSGTVTACYQCHFFHAFGVVPTLDFPNPAPQFPPKHAHHLELTVYVPHWTRSQGNSHLGPIPLQEKHFSPWWLGLVAIGFVSFGFASYIRKLPQKDLVNEARPDVAPQRAKEVPALDDTYQTNIRHLYIVGEAAGTASINLAMRSGRQVIEAIANELRHAPSPARPDLYDVVIVGCGPAGLGATATAKVLGLAYATLEKLTPASTLRSYPRAKFVQATPIDIAEYGSFFLEGDNSREELIREWEKIIGNLGLVINEREEVVGVAREQDYLVVKTARGNSYPSKSVVLAIGVRGNPRHLNLPGENPQRVFYNLIEPDEFTGRNILVIGGGNAGAEIVQSLAAPRLRNTVSYSFRSAVLTNVTPENADAIVALQKAKAITIYPATTLAEIRPRSIVLNRIKAADRTTPQDPQSHIEIENDFIFAMIGAELPAGFLRGIGIKMVSKGRFYG